MGHIVACEISFISLKTDLTYSAHLFHFALCRFAFVCVCFFMCDELESKKLNAKDWNMSKQSKHCADYSHKFTHQYIISARLDFGDSDKYCKKELLTRFYVMRPLIYVQKSCVRNQSIFHWLLSEKTSNLRFLPFAG